jgi:hypothetical protein
MTDLPRVTPIAEDKAIRFGSNLLLKSAKINIGMYGIGTKTNKLITKVISRIPG